LARSADFICTRALTNIFLKETFQGGLRPALTSIGKKHIFKVRPTIGQQK
jgi:hypothetical protein